MRLKKILIHGFKSFADRTVIELEGRGMTCIVGPNGCGKSNVIDSVKWILGEQRPTSLRGKEMTDVIFNGTSRRPPMGLCEGELVFDNRSRTLPIDEDEVRIMRRAFRSGETEYLINGRGVRLKDVRDTLAGTGLGQGGYGFMEQGKIDSILASHAVDRRRVFEEAAGISRFRTRKRESELKLRRVEDNLLRLGDIAEEVGRQIRSLKIQAGKARNHRDMSERMCGLQLRYNRHRYAELRDEQGRLESETTRLASEREARSGDRDGLRVSVKECSESYDLARARAEEERARLSDLRSQKTAVSDKLGLHRDHRDRAAERIAARLGEIQQLEDRLSQLDEDLVVTRREREDLQKDGGQITSRRQSKEADVEALEESLSLLRREVTCAEASLRSIEDEMHRLGRDLARQESSLGHQDSRLESIEGRRLELQGEREAVQQTLHERSGEQEDKTSNLEDRRLRLSEAEEAAEALEDAYVHAFDAVGEREQITTRARARREVLVGLFEAREGLDDGTRALLEEKDSRAEFLPGFRGLLLDLMEVEMEQAEAIALALGDRASALVVDTWDDAREGLRFLAEKGLGGASFLVRESFGTGGGSLPKGLRAVSPEMVPVVASLLEGLEMIPAESLDSRLASGDPFPRILVSAATALVRDGREFRVCGNGDDGSGLVVLSAELQGLERELPKLEAQLEEARAELQRARESRDEARTQVKEFSVALVKEEGEAARLDQEILRFVREIERLDAEGERLADDARALKRDRDETLERLAKLKDLRNSGEKSRGAAEEELQRRRSAAHEAAQVCDAGRHELSNLRIEETRLSERMEGLRSREKHLERSQSDARNRGAAAREEAEGAEAELTRLAGQIEEHESALAEFDAKIEEAESAVAAQEAETEGLRQSLAEAAERLEELEGAVADLADRLGDTKGRDGELRAALESLRERTQEELELDPDEVFKDASVEAEPPEGGWPGVEKEIKELRTRIARLGNVNLAAVEELEEAERRGEFLFGEKKDLDESRLQLQAILKDIEEHSIGLFTKTFEAVRAEFSDIFRRLFGGGKAEISLEDPSRPLESGIEIKARPPGKELRSIALLSGGERTMTAVALLFAIFRSNPAPCAFLDEVDAALDEDNIDRFCSVLEEFVERSQFIIVTHSRRTMEQSDLLLGVTMPERGVSRPVAVELEQIGDEGTISLPAGGAALEGKASDPETSDSVARSPEGDQTPGPKGAGRSSPSGGKRVHTPAPAAPRERRMEATPSARRVKAAAEGEHQEPGAAPGS